MPVGLGVDGSASNDSGHLFHEARTAFLAARVRDEDAAALTAREALEIATRGGAKVLGRDDIGHLAPGMAADFVAVNVDTPAFAGANHDIVAALILCQVNQVDYSFINGRRVVDKGRLMTVDVRTLLDNHRRLAERMIEVSLM